MAVFESKNYSLAIDEPDTTPEDVKVASPFCVRGWILSKQEKAPVALEVIIDGRASTRATLGLKREDLQAFFPAHPHALTGGFTAEVWVDDLVNRKIAVSLRALDADGEESAAEFEAHVTGLIAPKPPRKKTWVLRGILACPECGGGELPENDYRLRCQRCATDFQIRRQTPIFCSPGQVVQSKLFETNTTHPNSEDYTRIINRASGGIVLDYGAGNPPLSDYHPNVIFHDFVHYPSTDVVSTYDRLPYKDNTIDAVISKPVFEHIARPWDTAREIHRVLKPGGVVHVDTAFMQPLHGDPYHYFNMTLAGVREIFKPFKHVRSGIKPYQMPSFGYKMQIEVLLAHLSAGELRTRLDELQPAIAKDMDRSLDAAGQMALAAGFFFEGVKE
jgi:SAM-dependent methyltransferase